MSPAAETTTRTPLVFSPAQPLLAKDATANKATHERLAMAGRTAR
jgi:hypothetical protein